MRSETSSRVLRALGVLRVLHVLGRFRGKSGPYPHHIVSELQVDHGLDSCSSFHRNFSWFLPNFKNPPKNSQKWIWFDLPIWCVFCSFDPQIYCLRALPTLPPRFLVKSFRIGGFLELFFRPIFRPNLRSAFSALGSTTGLLPGERHYQLEHGTIG